MGVSLNGVVTVWLLQLNSNSTAEPPTPCPRLISRTTRILTHRLFTPSMTAYYPSQGSYSHHGHHHHGQPIVYSTSQGYGQPMVASTDYYQPGGVMYVPSSGSRRHHRHHPDRVPQVASVAAPVIMVRYIAACYLGLIRAHFKFLAAKQSWWPPPPSLLLFIRRPSTTILWFSAKDWRSLQVR